MGIVVEKVSFDAPAPKLATIVERIAELVGLPLVTRESPPDLQGTLLELHAHVAFEMYPKVEIQLTAYRAGAVEEQLRRTGMDAMVSAKFVTGANEAAGKQTVYARGYVGQEPTLLFATTLALEALGGRLDRPIPEDMRREFGHSITSEELVRRHDRLQRNGIQGWLTFGMLVLLLLVPALMITIVWYLMALPYRIWKTKLRFRRPNFRRPFHGA